VGEKLGGGGRETRRGWEKLGGTGEGERCEPHGQEVGVVGAVGGASRTGRWWEWWELWE